MNQEVLRYTCSACLCSYERLDDYDRHRRAVHGRAADGTLVVGSAAVDARILEMKMHKLARQLDDVQRQIAELRKLLEERR